VIGSGDDIVAKINEGLEQASARLIIFSDHSDESRWVEAEASYLTSARVQEGKVLIPVVVGGRIRVAPVAAARPRTRARIYDACVEGDA
jgi:hypothetical protein